MVRPTLFFLLLTGAAVGAEPRGPLSPANEAATFRLADERLTIELAAGEPEVDSPVAIAWDAEGRMYVAEMSDYPIGPGSGRVRLLTDRDGDGRYDQATVFAEGLNFPNGVLCWRGGVFVTASPDLWYLEDTEGDGRADERHVVWSGFAEGNQQLRANGLTWGLDNWIYGANGRSDGEIRRPGAPGEAISIRTQDFRFSPDGKGFEAIPGQSQFGQTRDDWGRRFLSWNTIAVRQVLLDPPILAAHPRLVSLAVRDIADPADGGRVFPISPRPQTFNREATDFYNALCGLSIYRGDALGDDYCGNAFVGESLTNLVHRRVLEADGPTFVSRRREADREFLAAADPWFHPVNTATGPDGALYIVDFYRRWVEHPNFVPGDLRGSVDWREGVGHGRIWRIRRRDSTEQKANAPRLSGADASQLVAGLSHPNGWRRDTAQRLLVERGDAESIPLLRQTVMGDRSTVARGHALWTLEGLGGLDETVLLAALSDRAAEVREQALRLAAERTSPSAKLVSAVRALSADPSLAVRFRLAVSLGGSADDEKLATWVSLVKQPDAAPWLLLSVSSALDERSTWRFLRRLLQDDPAWLDAPNIEQAAFLRQTAAMLRDRAEAAELLSLLPVSSPARIGAGSLALVAGLAQSVVAGDGGLRSPDRRLTDKAAATISAVIEAARRVAQDGRVEIAQRIDAIGVLGLDDPAAAAPLLVGLLSATQPQEVQSAAAATLGGSADVEAARRMFADWNTYTAATRRAVAAAALRRPAATEVLVEALEQGTVAVNELDAALREALTSIRDPALRERTNKIVAAAAPADRQAVLAQYQPALAETGDGRRGAALFRQHCLACHALHGLGHRVGADLLGVAARPKATLLQDVLDPSRQITPNFMSYTLVTTDGQILTGLLAAESAQAVTLLRPDGVQENVPRERVEELRASGKSLMPDGFEQKFDLSGMADLLEFLAHPSRELLLSP